MVGDGISSPLGFIVHILLVLLGLVHNDGWYEALTLISGKDK